MICPRCHELERALQVVQCDYCEAVASTFYRISVKFAAYKRVELERAKNELEEHRLLCARGVKNCAFSPTDFLRGNEFLCRRASLTCELVENAHTGAV
jgi:hypothetical protein